MPVFDRCLFLKGPFWICATLVVTIAISGNLANYLVHAGEHNWTYDFHKSEFVHRSYCRLAPSLPLELNYIYSFRLLDIIYIRCVYSM